MASANSWDSDRLHRSGSCRHQMAQGHGVAVWFQRGQFLASFKGGYEDGKAQGLGFSLGLPAGGNDGEWRDGKMNGRGISTWNDGGSEQGTWRDNALDGYGVSISRTRRRPLHGEWHHSLPTARGSPSPQMAKSTNGIWVNGCFKDGSRRVAVKLTWICASEGTPSATAVSRALPGCRPQGSTRTRGAAARPADRQYSGTGPPS